MTADRKCVYAYTLPQATIFRLGTKLKFFLPNRRILAQKAVAKMLNCSRAFLKNFLKESVLSVKREVNLEV